MKPRFQFSLWTLFVVVTLLAVVCGYVGWQAKIVRERNAAMKRATHAYAIYPMATSINGITWPRRWMGDVGIKVFFFDQYASDDDVDAIRSAFPEAAVYRDTSSETRD